MIDDKMDVGMDVGRLLDRFLDDFYSILGPFWEARWHQVGTKIQKKRVPKQGQKMSGKKVTRVSCDCSEGQGVWALKNIQKHIPNPTRNRKETTQHCQSRNTRLTASAVADISI